MALMRWGGCGWLQWKSSYSLGHYEYLQEYELRCKGCPFARGCKGDADRFTARYKLFIAGMDPHGSAFFKVYILYTSQRTTGTLPQIRNPLNKKSTRHSGPRIAANSYE